MQELVGKLHRQYDVAVQSGDLIFTDSTVKGITQGELEYEVRFAPALAKKPTAAKPAQSKQDKPADPFAAPYVPALHVDEVTVKAELEDGESDEQSFVVLLNKFCVQPRHFLLVTKEFVSQRLPLSPLEIYTTVKILHTLANPAATIQAEPHLAFFNCGELSGASQPHKHIQFIALPSGKTPFDKIIRDAKPKDASAKLDAQDRKLSAFTVSVLPFAHYITPIEFDPDDSVANTAGGLLARYLLLLDLAAENISQLQQQDDVDKSKLPSSASRMSYNLVVTLDYLMLVPRSQEKFESGASEAVPLNSLAFAGMPLVKSQEQLDTFAGGDIAKALASVCFPVARG
ncbi:uncharacterized protein L969DRAFT_104676 [Mixia osmundae IAM 14324]|uniref:Uncharacterized protein n=1 Tax=Mixia osmundae (strain CBS 9802 / IAM 14324 / JCM 22182 / KY 12970) TaxID=764103 RepID=G7DX19_MIXOS|nr:uncharacterized protein L969DRAFT_104676 [Mixia osmundae IAM 14324]KEI38075.1 hypothetical protein L969DRAFT_104676 [Mixia osmundae IAM 14324]GAA95116.1 hypothetical protein E5Q_01771 [Mixia osmundae IAM 14324]